MNATPECVIELPIYTAENWKEGANCLGLDSADFVTETGHFRKVKIKETPTDVDAPITALAAVCGRCPVQGWCLTDAFASPDGYDGHAYRAGTTPKERKRMDVTRAKDNTDRDARGEAAAAAIEAAHDAGMAAARDIVLALLTEPPSTYGDIIDDEVIAA